MIFSGIKKVRDKFNLTDDGMFVKGIVKNSRVRLNDGHNCKVLHISAPTEISTAAGEALKAFSQKPYKAKVQVDTNSVTYTFLEILTPYSAEKICQVLEGASKIIYDQNPSLPPPEEDPADDAASSKKAVNVGSVVAAIGGMVIAFAAPFLLKEWRAIKYASDLAQSIQSSCPAQIDEWTTLDSARSSLFKVYLDYTVEEFQDLEENADQIIKENFIQNLRDSGSNKELFERTIWFILTYKNVAGEELFSIKIVPVDYK